MLKESSSRTLVQTGVAYEESMNTRDDVLWGILIVNFTCLEKTERWLPLWFVFDFEVSLLNF